MRLWYKCEPFRCLPNIEIVRAEDNGYYISFCWMKIVLSLKISV